jgi:hypothetical protein
MGKFGNNLIIFNGGNTVVVFALELGVHGCVWGIANPVPKACVELGRRGLCTGTARPCAGCVGGAAVRLAIRGLTANTVSWVVGVEGSEPPSRSLGTRCARPQPPEIPLCAEHLSLSWRAVFRWQVQGLKLGPVKTGQFGL